MSSTPPRDSAPRSWPRIVLALTVGVVGVGSGTATQASVRIHGCGVPGAVQPKPGGWTAITTPTFTNPATGTPATMTGLWVDPIDPAVMLIHDHYTLRRTSDGGCHWKVVFQIGAVPRAANEPFTSASVLGDTGVIADVRSGESGPAARRVYLLVSNIDTPGFWGAYRSDDAGATWRLTPGSGVPSEYIFNSIAPSPTKPDHVYLSGRVATSYNKVIFGSDDGGTTWTKRAETTETATTGLFHLTVDPVNPNDLWAYEVNSLRHSTDGGRSWRTVDPSPAPCQPTATNCHHGVTSMLVVHHPGRPAQIWVTPLNSLSDTNGYVWGVRVSSDGGKHWRTISTPDHCLSLARATADTSVTLACAKGNDTDARVSRADVLLWVPGRHRWRAITPAFFQPPKTFNGFTVTRTAPAAVIGYVDNQYTNQPWIMRWLGRV